LAWGFKEFSAIDLRCVVPNALTLNTHQRDMRKKNKVVKLTDRKIRYIIRAKIRGEGTKRIAQDMKLSPSTVKRVWMYWTKTKMLLSIKNLTSPAFRHTYEEPPGFRAVSW